MPAEVYACTVPRCIELMKIARQFKNLPLDYAVGDESEHEFHSFVIQELIAQRQALEVDWNQLTGGLASVFIEWGNDHGAHLSSEVIVTVAKMKIIVDAWRKTTSEVEEMGTRGGVKFTN